MKRRFAIAPATEQDIVEIGEYVARGNRPAALKLAAEIYDCFPLLAERPGIGHRRPDLTSLPVRFWTVRGRYLACTGPRRHVSRSSAS